MYVTFWNLLLVTYYNTLFLINLVYVPNLQYVVLFKNIVYFSVLFERGVRPTRDQVKQKLFRKYPTYDKEPILFDVQKLLAMAAERDREVKASRKAAKEAKLNRSLEEHQLRKCKNNFFVYVFMNTP